MKIRVIQSGFCVRSILRMAVSAILLISSLDAPANGQTAPANEPSGLYAGIELSIEGAKAVALRVSRGEEEPGLKVIYTEFIRLSLGRTSSGGFKPRATLDAAEVIQKLLMQLRQQHQIQSERIYLIGSSELGAEHPQDLVSTIAKMTGKTLTFLDPETEIRLSIAGTIPRREKVGTTWADSRNSSILIDFGSNNTKAGYQLLKYSLSSPPSYDFVTTNIAQGTVRYSNEVRRNQGETGDWSGFIQSVRDSGGGRFRDELRSESGSKPGLLNRKRVYLTGGIAWALATLLYPEKRQAFVPLRSADIARFIGKAGRDPRSLLNPNLSYIDDRELRQEVGQELIAVRNSFTPQQLVAGAELLRIVSEQLKWKEKQILFARFGHLGCILSYVRLQTEK